MAGDSVAVRAAARKKAPVYDYTSMLPAAAYTLQTYAASGGQELMPPEAAEYMEDVAESMGESWQRKYDRVVELLDKAPVVPIIAGAWAFYTGWTATGGWAAAALNAAFSLGSGALVCGISFVLARAGPLSRAFVWLGKRGFNFFLIANISVPTLQRFVAQSTYLIRFRPLLQTVLADKMLLAMGLLGIFILLRTGAWALERAAPRLAAAPRTFLISILGKRDRNGADPAPPANAPNKRQQTTQGDDIVASLGPHYESSEESEFGEISGILLAAMSMPSA